jgi:hypothetical protein
MTPGENAVRDLARYLAASRPAVTGWQLTAASDVEAFLATIASPANRARQLHALRVFFRWARSHHLILADPARGLHPSSNIPFHGRLLPASEQRQLLHRWTADRRRGNAAPARTRSRPAQPAARRLRRRTAPAARHRHRPGPRHHPPWPQAPPGPAGPGHHHRAAAWTTTTAITAAGTRTFSSARKARPPRSQCRPATSRSSAVLRRRGKGPTSPVREGLEASGGAEGPDSKGLPALTPGAPGA